VTFAPGDTSETVTVQTIDDALSEGAETFNVNLSSPTGNAAILDGLGVGTIPANDQQSNISIDNAAATEGGAVGFTVSLDAPQAAPVTVQFATADVTAVAPGDYTAATGTVTFAPGDISEPVTVQTINDALVEGTETFNVNLSNPSANGVILDGLGVGTINDNDQPAISIGDQTVTEGGAASFNVTLDQASGQTVTVQFATANGTAVAPGDYTAGTGTVTFAPGDTAETVTVQTNNDTVVEATETFNVNLSNATNATIADNQGVGTILDNDQSAISIDNQTVTEGGMASFNVTLDQASPSTVTVQFATADVTAVAPGDYTAATGTVTFAPGDTSETVTVQTIDDADVEAQETFNVNLSNATNATIADGLGVGTINDNDQPQISIDDQTVTEGGSASFNVTLDRTSPTSVTVDFATADVTAVAPGDYTGGTGTVTFAPGDTSETVTVQTNQDALDENDETFNVNLSNPSPNATILDGLGVGTIVDDDDPPAISINDASTPAPEFEGAAVSFTVSLDAASGKQVTVDFATADVTAVAPGDYTAATGTVTFAPGDTSETVTVQTIDDIADEPDETFNVNLSNASNATIADGLGVGTIVDDDVPLVTDATGTVIVNGPVTSAKTSKSFVFKVTNAGMTPITINESNITSSVDVGTPPTPTGSVAVSPFTKTLNPGASTRVKLVWSYAAGALATGDAVVFHACVNVAGDSIPVNDCDDQDAIAK